jgi:hypothetical protein
MSVCVCVCVFFLGLKFGTNVKNKFEKGIFDFLGEKNH